MISLRQTPGSEILSVSQYCVQPSRTAQVPSMQQDEMLKTSGGAAMPQTRPDMLAVSKL
jgi:hypothetical protein